MTDWPLTILQPWIIIIISFSVFIYVMACMLLLIVEEGKKVWRIKSRGHQTFVLRGSVGDDLHVEGNWSANECVRTGTWYRKHDDGDQSKRQLIYTCKKNNNLYMCHWWLLFHTVVYSEISKCVKMTSGFLKFTLNFKKLLIITVLLPQHWRYLTNWICDC